MPASSDFVQSVSAVGLSSVTTYSLAFTNDIVAGHVILAAHFQWPHTVDPVAVTLSDNLGNSYRKIGAVVQTVNSDNISCDVFASVVQVAGTCTVAADWSSGTAAFPSMILHEYTGAYADGFAAASGTPAGTPVTDADSSGNITTTRDGEMIASFRCTTGGATSAVAGTGFTQRESIPWNASGTKIQSEDKPQVTAGAVAGTWTAGIGGLAGDFLVTVAGVAPPPAIGQYVTRHGGRGAGW